MCSLALDLLEDELARRMFRDYKYIQGKKVTNKRGKKR